MAAIIILVNREIVNPGWFLPKNVIYVVKKLATVVFEDFIWEGGRGREGGAHTGQPVSYPKLSKFIFLRSLHSFDPFQIYKIPEFRTAATLWTYRRNLLENRHPKVSKNRYCFIRCGESKKGMCKCKLMNY